MWTFVAASTLVALITPAFATASSNSAKVAARATILGKDNAPLNRYDYVIIGAGASGLTVADRLTENPTVKVLVIEAGEYAPGEETILVPGDCRAIPQKYFWSIPSVPMAGLNNRSYSITAGKTVGGSTAVNGMFMPRGSRGDYDIWRDLGNYGWGFDDILPYFKKSETFTPPPREVAEELGITWDMRYHGTTGPVQSSYPPFLYPEIKLFLNAIREIGSHVPNDYASGDALGGYWVPNTLDPVNRTRSFARTAHYQSVSRRSNLHLLPNNTVTKITFSGTTATGVKYSSGRGQPIHSVLADKEVIVAAGAPLTPQLLQISGVGPKTLLKSLGIPVVSDLPGVGANFHDHPTLFVGANFMNDMNPSPSNTTNTTWMGEQEALYQSSREGVYTTCQANSAAFLPLSELTSSSTDIINRLQSQNPQDIYPAGTDPTVIAGWKAQRDLLIKYTKQPKVAYGEIAMGAGAGGALSLVKPYSRGTITINSTDPFDIPVLDFGTFRNPLDLEVFVEIVRTWKKLLQASSLQPLNPVIISPADNVTSTEDIGSYIRTNAAATFAHPSGSAPMMRKDLGGVIGPDLLVYGTRKLSIIDASILPIAPATHLTSTMYAVAEKAADIIKARAFFSPPW